MNFFMVLRESPSDLYESIRDLAMDRRTYYSVRRHRPVSPLGRAARTAYLTTLSFNGIYRVNREGRFNVPYGRRPNRSLADPSWIYELSAKLQEADLRCVDFRLAVAGARTGDFVYFDPPYTVLHDNNGFIRYNERLFSFEDQRQLATLAKTLVENGVHVIVSNAYHDSVLALYEGPFDMHVVTRPSSMAADASRRGAKQEAIIVGRT
jgi:DNA adenine methylase